MRCKYYRFLILLLPFITLASCTNGDEPLPGPDKPIEAADRMILVYMAANNSLGSGYYDSKDIREMKTAAQQGALGTNNRLLIYHAATDGSQTLYEMTPSGGLETLKVYDTNLTSVMADRMLEVFTDSKKYAPAHDYGLILWSHSLGWTQEGIDDNGPSTLPKSWGNDRGKTMNITTLKKVLELSPWSWIYFDCCFMGSVEVLYELAPVLDSAVASATEVPLDGMPYDENLRLLFARQVDLVGAAQNTFEYYDNQFGSNRTCTISVYDLTKIEALANSTIPIYRESEIVGPMDFSNLALQTTSSPNYYDLGVYVAGLCDINGLPSELYSDWQKAYNDVVLFEKATPYLWNVINLSRFTGLSTFIPYNETQLTYKNYDTLAWYKSVAKYLYNK